MTTPGSPVGPTAADSGSGSDSPGWSQEPGLARPYATNPAREFTSGRRLTAAPEDIEAGLPQDWRDGGRRRSYRDWRDYYEDGDYQTGEFGTGEFSFPKSLWAEPATKDEPAPDRPGARPETAPAPAPAAQGANI